MYRGLKISAVIPAFNEALAIGKVVTEVLALHEDGVPLVDDLVVCDNASTDGTAKIALQHGARVVYQDTPGYGIACLTALKNIEGCDIVLFVDGDDSCYVDQAVVLLQSIAQGDDVAIGSRVMGCVERGALTSVQRFGNALSAALIRIIWQAQVTDLGPFRAVRQSALEQIDMQDKAFGWTVEMQVKAIQLGLQLSEYAVDSKVRIGKSKISGTVKGSVLAGIGILSKIFVLRWQQSKLLNAARVKNAP